MLGAPTGETRDASADDPLYVPVTNVNYIPGDGGGILEGFVPDHPGNDKTLLRQKEALEAMGLESGPDVSEPVELPEEELPPVDPEEPDGGEGEIEEPPPVDPESPIDQDNRTDTDANTEDRERVDLTPDPTPRPF